MKKIIVAGTLLSIIIQTGIAKEAVVCDEKQGELNLLLKNTRAVASEVTDQNPLKEICEKMTADEQAKNRYCRNLDRYNISQEDAEKLASNLATIQANENSNYRDYKSLRSYLLDSRFNNPDEEKKAASISLYLKKGFKISSAARTHLGKLECWFKIVLSSKSEPSVSLEFGFDTEAGYLDQQQHNNIQENFFLKDYSLEYRNTLDHCTRLPALQTHFF